MTSTDREFLFEAKPPWITIGPDESRPHGTMPSAFYSREGLEVCVRVVRGFKMHSSGSFMNEVAAALHLSNAFVGGEWGENWSALLDALTCLDEWLPAEAFVIDVRRADELLVEEGSDELSAFLLTMNDAAGRWAEPIVDNGRFDRPARPFHVLLDVANADDVQRFVRASERTGVPLRQDGWRSA